MPDIQDGLQAALFICLLVTLALTVMLAIIMGVLQYCYSSPPPRTRTQPQPQPHRPSVYYPTTRSSIENTYHIACHPDRPQFRNIDWSYGTFQNRLESGPGGPRGSAGGSNDDEHIVRKGWRHVSPHGQVEVPGAPRIAAEGSKDVDRNESTKKPASSQQLVAQEDDENDGEGDITEGSSTPQATTPQRRVGSDWAERTRSGRIHSV